jgi:hypothetical protein
MAWPFIEITLEYIYALGYPRCNHLFNLINYSIYYYILWTSLSLLHIRTFMLITLNVKYKSYWI